MQKLLVSLLLIALASSSLLIPNKNVKLLSYSRPNSQKWAAYSSITHCPKDCILTWSCGTTSKYPKLVNVTYLQNSISKAVGFIGYEASTQTLVTSWRGSSNAQNWIQDFNFETIPYTACSGCLIHSGFMFDYKSNQKALLAHAQAIMKFYKVSKIVCTGQSLGGAISVINGIQFFHHFPSIPIQVHNFGCPRVGNSNLAQYLKSKLPNMFRVVHNQDLVPHLPPQAFAYRHPPYEVFYDEKMTTYKVCNDSGEDKSCSDQFAPNYNTNDHDFYFIQISQPKCK